MDFLICNPVTKSPNPLMGPCGVCDHICPLVYRDVITGIKFGHCCYSAMVTTGAALHSMVNRPAWGLRHPFPDEFSQSV